LSFNHACPDVPAAQIADSAETLGTAWIGAGVVLAQGRGRALPRGDGHKLPQVAPSALLLDGAELTGDVVVGEDAIMGAGAVVSVVSDGCILGEGTLIPPAHRSPASTCDSKATAVSTSNTRRMSAGISAARAEVAKQPLGTTCSPATLRSFRCARSGPGGRAQLPAGVGVGRSASRSSLGRARSRPQLSRVGALPGFVGESTRRLCGRRPPRGSHRRSQSGFDRRPRCHCHNDEV
jgi:hypothetical protein